MKVNDVGSSRYHMILVNCSSDLVVDGVASRQVIELEGQGGRCSLVVLGVPGLLRGDKRWSCF